MLLVDIRHKADPKDIIMLEMLRMAKIPFVVAATKSDKIISAKIMNTCQKLKETLGLRDEEIIPFSSLKKQGIDKVLTWIGSRIL